MRSARAARLGLMVTCSVFLFAAFGLSAASGKQISAHLHETDFEIKNLSGVFRGMGAELDGPYQCVQNRKFRALRAKPGKDAVVGTGKADAGPYAQPGHVLKDVGVSVNFKVVTGQSYYLVAPKLKANGDTCKPIKSPSLKAPEPEPIG